MQYSAHEGFVAPARERNEIWRLLAGIAVALLVYILIAAAIVAAAFFLTLPEGFWGDVADWANAGGTGTSPLETHLLRQMSGQTPTQVLVLLATFAGMFLGAMAAARWLHGRRFVTLTGPLPVMWRHFGIAALVAAPLLAASFFIPPTLVTEANLPTGLWLTFLPLALGMVLLQTGAEELLFRGYLQQQLAARFRSPLVWLVLPSVLFGLGHFSPEQYGSSAWIIVGVTTLVGLFAADLTARTGTIGAAWGFHFANNVAAILIVSLEGPLSGLSLRLIPGASITDEVMQLALLRDIAVIAVIWLVIRRVLRK